MASSSSSQWHSITPATRPLSLSILELTPLALTLSLTLASVSSSATPFSNHATSTPKRKKRTNKRGTTDSDDDSTAVEADESDISHLTPSGSSGHIGHTSSHVSLHLPGSYPSDGGVGGGGSNGNLPSFKDLLSHGVVVSVNGQSWNRIVAHVSDPEESDHLDHHTSHSEGQEGEDWDGDTEDWEEGPSTSSTTAGDHLDGHSAHHGGRASDDEGQGGEHVMMTGADEEGLTRRRPRRARFMDAAQNAIGGGKVKRREGGRLRRRRDRRNSDRDRAVVVVYGLTPGKEYEIELRVVGLGGNDAEVTISNSVLLPPSQSGLLPRSRANSVRSRGGRSRSNSMNTQQPSSETPTPPGAGPTPPLNGAASDLIAPTPVLSATDTQTAQLRHLIAATSVERDHLSSQIKEARRSSQRAEAALRQEIETVKKATEKAGSMDLRAKQKALALQEQVKQAWNAAESAEKETTTVENSMNPLEAKLEGTKEEIESVRLELRGVKEKEDEARERDKRMRLEEEKKLNEVISKIEKLKLKKEKKEMEHMELEKKVEELLKQNEEIERKGEEEIKRKHWNHTVNQQYHNTYNSPGYRGTAPRGGGHSHSTPQGYQQQGRFPLTQSSGGGRSTSGGIGAGGGGGISNSPSNHNVSNNFYGNSHPSNSPNYRPSTIKPTTVGTSSPATQSRNPSGPSSASTTSATTGGPNASAAPFVPSSIITSTSSPSNSSTFTYDNSHQHTTLMPPGMQHRIYAPSSHHNHNQQNLGLGNNHQNQNIGIGTGGVTNMANPAIGSNVRTRPTPTPNFHPPPSVIAEQQSKSSSSSSPTISQGPNFPPLPGNLPSGAAGANKSPPSAINSASPASSGMGVSAGGGGGVGSGGADRGGGGPSLASIVTRAVLSPTSSLAQGNTTTQNISGNLGVGGGGTRPSPPPGSNSTSMKPPNSGPGTTSNSPPNSSTPTTASYPSSIHSGAPIPSQPRVTFGPPPNSGNNNNSNSNNDQGDFPPLSPTGPWAGFNLPTTNTGTGNTGTGAGFGGRNERIRSGSGDSSSQGGGTTGNIGVSSSIGNKTIGEGFGMIRTQTPPLIGVWERRGSPVNPVNPVSGNQRKATE